MARRVYLDLGGYDGDTAQAFREQDKDAFIFVFEANVELIDAIKDRNIPNCSIVDRAVWICDGYITLFRGRGSAESSSVLRSKKRTTGKNPINAKCIDFVRWVKDNLNKEDYVIMKMDIEGAEYEVIPYLFEHNIFKDYIDELTIEMHADKIKSRPYDKIHKEIVNKLNNIGFKKLTIWREKLKNG